MDTLRIRHILEADPPTALSVEDVLWLVARGKSLKRLCDETYAKHEPPAPLGSYHACTYGPTGARGYWITVKGGHDDPMVHEMQRYLERHSIPAPYGTPKSYQWVPGEKGKRVDEYLRQLGFECL